MKLYELIIGESFINGMSKGLILCYNERFTDFEGVERMKMVPRGYAINDTTLVSLLHPIKSNYSGKNSGLGNYYDLGSILTYVRPMAESLAEFNHKGISLKSEWSNINRNNGALTDKALKMTSIFSTDEFPVYKLIPNRNVGMHYKAYIPSINELEMLYESMHNGSMIRNLGPKIMKKFIDDLKLVGSVGSDSIIVSSNTFDGEDRPQSYYPGGVMSLDLVSGARSYTSITRPSCYVAFLKDDRYDTI